MPSFTAFGKLADRYTEDIYGGLGEHVRQTYTTDGDSHTLCGVALGSLLIPNATSSQLFVSVTGINDGTAGGTAGDTMTYNCTWSVVRVDSLSIFALNQITATPEIFQTGGATSWSVNLNPNSPYVDVDVRGDSGVNVVWTATVFQCVAAFVPPP